MAEQFTIESVMKTGKNSPQFGSEYYVKFHESEGTFPLWYKAEPVVGQAQAGDIEGSKFKKEKKEWNPTGPAPTVTTPSASPAPKPAYKDNSDGMRKGMAINNAAQYVMNFATEPVTPEVWAKTVTDYARALYKASELDT